MKRNILALLFSAGYFFAQSQNLKNPQNAEPAEIFELNINGKTYNILENQELRLDTLLSKPTISIKLLGYKIFKESSISFEYPRHLLYDFEQDFAFKNWMFSGNSTVVSVIEMDVKVSLVDFINEMVDGFGKENCAVKNFKRRLGGKMRNGKILFVSLADQDCVIEFYEIKLNDSKSRFIYFQDVLEENEHTEEYENVLSLISSTINI